MKIVYVAHFARGADGSSATDADLVAALRARGVEVHVLSPYADPEVGRPGGSVAVGRLPRLILAIPGYARALVAALRLSRGGGTRLLAQYHVFQPATAVAFLVARLRGLPLVVRAHTLLPGSYRSRAESLVNGLSLRAYRRILRHRHTWVLVSGPEWRDASVDRLALNPDRVRILPDNVTPAPEPSPEAVERLRASLGGEGAIVLKFGSHTREGVATFVEAMRRLPRADARGVVLADPGWGDVYRLEADRRGASERIRVMGPLPRGEVRAWLSIARACVGLLSDHPMARGSIPRSTLEAMAAGVPVVMCRGVVSSLLPEDGKNCVLVPPDDPVALAVALGRILDDGALARSLGTGAQQVIASRFHSDIIAERLETLLANVPDEARD